MKEKAKRGVRIPKIADALGDRYDRFEIDRQPQPRYVKPLACGGCGSRVGARHGNADDPDSRSSHYFKIDPHRPDCRFDLDQRGKQLVDTSHGTVVRLSGQWRLICPAIGRLGSSGTTKQPASPARPGSAGGSGPRATSKKSGQAIASARRIVQILNDFDQDPEVAASFAATAPSGQRNITWSEFCRGRGDVDQLAQALIDGTAPAIPHAVWGPASTVGAAGERSDTYLVSYVAQRPVHIDGTAVRLRVALRSTTPDWIGATTRSGQFLGYGEWELFPTDLDRARRKGWIELQLWVKQPWQVERWDTDDTTITLPEPRPKPPAARTRTPTPSPTPPLVLPTPQGSPEVPAPAPRRANENDAPIGAPAAAAPPLPPAGPAPGPQEEAPAPPRPSVAPPEPEAAPPLPHLPPAAPRFPPAPTTPPAAATGRKRGLGLRRWLSRRRQT
ncbi:hypothetical protein [Streptomyces sp. NPDC058268]|uniref:hypothetical protein n=1 Tax=Streptomyces sp. NPDC058268 TaxID=3346413 RepID=UPI0036E2683A